MITVTHFIIFFCVFIGLLLPVPCTAEMYTQEKSKTRQRLFVGERFDIWQNRSLNNILKIVAPLIPLPLKITKKR